MRGPVRGLAPPDLVTAGSNEIESRVEVELSAGRPDAVALIEELYAPLVRATVLDPTGAHLEEPGTVHGLVVDELGQPLQAAIDPRALFADIGLDSIGRGSDDAGRFVLERWLPGRWRITATKDGFEPASVEVDVPAGESVDVTIVLQPAP